MKAHFLALLVLLLLGFTGRQPLHAQDAAISRAEGESFLQLGISWHSADEEFGLDGRRRGLFSDSAEFLNPNYGQTDLSLYGELGITDWLTGVAETHFRTIVRQARFRSTERDSAVSASGLGDIWLRARVRLLDTTAPYSATVTLGWKAPTGSPLQAIPLGTGVADYALGGAFRLPFRPGELLPAHLELAGTYLLRHKASDEIDWAVRVGVDLGRGVDLTAGLDGVHSTADFDAALANPAAASVNTTLVGDLSFTDWMLALRLPAGEGILLGATYASRLSGRNALATSIFGLNLSWLRH